MASRFSNTFSRRALLVRNNIDLRSRGTLVEQIRSSVRVLEGKISLFTSRLFKAEREKIKAIAVDIYRSLTSSVLRLFFEFVHDLSEALTPTEQALRASAQRDFIDDGRRRCGERISIKAMAEVRRGHQGTGTVLFAENRAGLTSGLPLRGAMRVGQIDFRWRNGIVQRTISPSGDGRVDFGGTKFRQNTSFGHRRSPVGRLRR